MYANKSLTFAIIHGLNGLPDASGKSRIFLGRGRQLPKGCANLLFWIFFGWKLHENERIGGMSLASPWIRQWIHINWVIDDQILLSVSRWFGWKEMIWFSSVLVTKHQKFKLHLVIKAWVHIPGSASLWRISYHVAAKRRPGEYEESIRVFPILVLKLGEFILLVESDNAS